MHIDITIYGPQTSSITWLTGYLRGIVHSAGRTTTIAHVDDVDGIIDSGIGSVPAVMVDGGQPLLQSDYTDFMSFTHAIMHEMLSERGYGSLTKLVVPVLPDFDFRNGLLYAYRLACDIGAVVQVHLGADSQDRDQVDYVISSILSSHSDLALGTALIYIADTVDFDVVIWSYSTPVCLPWSLKPTLYVPSALVYQPVEVLCYHAGKKPPLIVSQLWPDIELCDGRHRADCVVTDKIDGVGDQLLFKL